MSSKRKSPPTKFQEGGGLATAELENSATILPPTLSVPNSLSSVGGGCGGSDGGGLTDMDESSSNNLSDIGDEDRTPVSQGANTASLYKLTDSSSSSVASGSELEDCPAEPAEPSPPNKKQRLLCPTQHQMEYHNNDKSNLVPPPSSLLPALSAIHLQQEHQPYQEPVDGTNSRRRSSSDCGSPTLDVVMKTGGVSNHNNNNNNNSMTHNNNSTSGSHPVKRSMDDVLKRLTSKMHISNVREEKRPTPASTPTGKSLG
jgi:hypothetical protein